MCNLSRERVLLLLKPTPFSIEAGNNCLTLDNAPPVRTGNLACSGSCMKAVNMAARSPWVVTRGTGTCLIETIGSLLSYAAEYHTKWASSNFVCEGLSFWACMFINLNLSGVDICPASNKLPTLPFLLISIWYFENFRNTTFSLTSYTFQSIAANPQGTGIPSYQASATMTLEQSSMESWVAVMHGGKKHVCQQSLGTFAAGAWGE